MWLFFLENTNYSTIQKYPHTINFDNRLYRQTIFVARPNFSLGDMQGGCKDLQININNIGLLLMLIFIAPSVQDQY